MKSRVGQLGQIVGNLYSLVLSLDGLHSLVHIHRRGLTTEPRDAERADRRDSVDCGASFAPGLVRPIALIDS